MSQISSMFGNAPGMQAAIETFEQAVAWGPYPRYYTGAYIGSTCADPTNSPTWELRVGLVMGLQSTGTWVNYSPTATDGSEIARGILPLALRMQDVITGINTTKFYAIMVSGGVKGLNLIGLDNMARCQMAKQFIFDDNLAGLPAFPWQRFQNKVANYQLVASDNESLFTTLGATGEVDFTLPPIANGYYFGFAVQAAQTMKVISNEGGNIIALNNLTANSLAFSTGGQQIGGMVYVYSNPAGTKWIVENSSAGVAAITVA
jgi:hypothetical protein